MSFELPKQSQYYNYKDINKWYSYAVHSHQPAMDSIWRSEIVAHGNKNSILSLLISAVVHKQSIQFCVAWRVEHVLIKNLLAIPVRVTSNVNRTSKLWYSQR